MKQPASIATAAAVPSIFVLALLAGYSPLTRPIARLVADRPPPN